MSKLDDAYEKAMKAAGDAGLPKVVHGLPADGDYVGTCQVCFGQYVVKQFKSFESRAGSGAGFINLKPMPKGKLVVVLHGYQRPGHGYTEGECPGRGHEPFEIAKDVTELFLKNRIRQVADLRKTLAEMKRGDVVSLWIALPDKTKPRDPRTYKYPDKLTEIKPGWVNENPEYSYQTDNFERRLKLAIANLESDVRFTEGVIEFLEKMLRRWKYDPQAITRTTGKKIGVRAEDQEKAEAESRARSEQRNAARDLKEKKARSVLNAYLAHAQLIERAKNTPHMIRPDKRTFHEVPSGKSMFEHISQQYIGAAEKETNQVRRIELLKYANERFRDLAHGRFGRGQDEIKVKLPRG